ncbi:MAG: sigma-70 family RNA polymerase sigma factor [Pirellulales bacterium]|nr:sigma-70 family RNA polymerase sigma factor [Pirellulales bacterium]
MRLRQFEDVDAWSEFLRDYGPMLYRFVRSRGLQDADASDLVQDVVRSVGMAIGRLDYDKAKGGFRAWLFTIARNKLYTYFEKRGRTLPAQTETGEIDRLQGQQSIGELESQWELEHQRTMLARAIENLKPEIEPKTWQAFELTAMEGLSGSEAGAKLGMKAGSVYVARSRVTAKLRDEVERLLAEEV